ncbi:MAG: type IV secretion system protein [Rickettsiales bacterium]
MKKNARSGGGAGMFSTPREKNGAEAPASSAANRKNMNNWYGDRYNGILMQRNFMAVISLVCLGAVIVSVLVVAEITSQKTIEPFVIQVEEKSGMTQVVRPIAKTYIDENKALNNYFIVRYLRAREEYFPPTYEYDYQTVTRLLSSEEVFRAFRRDVSPANETSPVRWGEQGTRDIRILSVLDMETPEGLKGHTVQVRFLVTDKMLQSGAAEKTTQYAKVARIRYDYIDMELTDEELYVNPVGFQVLQYKTTQEYVEKPQE